MAKVLIIDDDKTFCAMLAQVVERAGHTASCASMLDEGLREAASGEFDIVYLDVHMPDGSGLDILPQIRAARSEPEVIIITGRGDADGAELAIKNGAWDYLVKPATIDAMLLPLTRALQYRKERMARRPPMVLKRDFIIGSSPQIQACLDLVAKAAVGDSNVLITGETGTGKELFAQAIHLNSPRASQRFVVVDCTAIPETLAESTLFGYVRGAFTGADKAKEGLVKQADGGTLFLDEVGELPLGIQKTFLRVLQEHRFRPLGNTQEVESRFRLVAATNRDLDEMASRGQFRKDLLFRIRSFTLSLPPLREHREDIKELAIFHIARICEHNRMALKGACPEFFDALTVYEWPGNVRELVHALESALNVASAESTLFVKHLPTAIRVHVARTSFKPAIAFESPRAIEEPHEAGAPPGPVLSPFPSLKEVRRAAIAAAEKHYLQDLMNRTAGDINEACRLSRLSRARLYALLKLYAIALVKP